jgi:hypothetical protein
MDPSCYSRRLCRELPLAVIAGLLRSMLAEVIPLTAEDRARHELLARVGRIMENPKMSCWVRTRRRAGREPRRALRRAESARSRSAR